MLSDCLSNYIGIRGFSTDTIPESGLYVNDLPSVSLKMLSNISNDEQKNYSEIWDELYTRTLNQLESDVLIKAQKYFKTSLVLDNSITGYHADPYEVELSSADFKGVTIEADQRKSKYLSIYVNSVNLYLPGAVSDNIYIYNLMNGELLDTIPFVGLVGNNIIEINKKYITYGQDTKIFICYNSTDVGNSIKTDMIDYSSTVNIYGAKVSTGSSVIDSNLTKSGDSYGMIANYNIRCDISEFICSSKDVLKYAIWWKLGSSIMFERMTSNRMNKFTLNKSAVEIKELWEYYEDEYNKIMDSVMDNLEANSDNICFSCRKQRNYKYLKP
jgi:hypothetical protein